MANESPSTSTVGEKVDNYLDSVPERKRADATKEIFHILMELKTRIMQDADMNQVNALLEKLVKLPTEQSGETTNANDANALALALGGLSIREIINL